MKILITGSSGFIGFHLSKKLLDNGHKVYGYDSMNNYYDVRLKKARYNILKKYKNFSFTKSKLENKISLEKVFKRFKPKIVIHLAAQAGVRESLNNPLLYVISNTSKPTQGCKTIANQNNIKLILRDKLQNLGNIISAELS